MTPLPVRQVARRRHFDAIVVGSGVGGAVAAATLAGHRRRVLVIDKNPLPGGILASRPRPGWRLDAGSHLIARGERGPFGALFRELGLPHPRFLTHPVPIRSRGIFEMIAPPTNLGLIPAAFRAARTLGLGPRESARVARLWLEVMTMPERELRAWDHRSLDAFLRRHSEHPGVYFLVGFMASIFFVLPPWQVSAGESIRCLRALLTDYRLSYVEGGMEALIEALLQPVLAAGGELVLGDRVTQVAPGRPLAVVTAAGRAYSAPAVVLNLAPRDVLGLVEPARLGETWCERARHITPSGAAHQLKLGLRRRVFDEGCLIGGFSSSGLTISDLSLPLMERTVAEIADGKITDPLAIYAPIPTNFDPSLAPPGHQLVLASVYGSPTPRDPPERWIDATLHALAQVAPTIADDVVFAELSSVAAVGAWMGKSSAAAISNGQTPDQVGAGRLPVSTPVPGLYLAGDGAGGRGIGTELAASSGREAATRILAEVP